MKISYNGKAYFKDGTMHVVVTNCTSIEEARAEAHRTVNKKSVHFYKFKGVDYGKEGKWMSQAEQYGGLEKITVIKKTIEEIE